MSKTKIVLIVLGVLALLGIGVYFYKKKEAALAAATGTVAGTTTAGTTAVSADGTATSALPASGTPVSTPAVTTSPNSLNSAAPTEVSPGLVARFSPSVTSANTAKAALGRPQLNNAGTSPVPVTANALANTMTMPVGQAHNAPVNYLVPAPKLAPQHPQQQFNSPSIAAATKNITALKGGNTLAIVN